MDKVPTRAALLLAADAVQEQALACDGRTISLDDDAAFYATSEWLRETARCLRRAESDLRARAEKAGEQPATPPPVPSAAVERALAAARGVCGYMRSDEDTADMDALRDALAAVDAERERKP